MAEHRTPEQLEEFVKKMRELGVAECDGIRLGALPVPVPSKADLEAAAVRAAEMQTAKEDRQRDTMFAHSHVKPKLRAVKQ